MTAERRTEPHDRLTRLCAAMTDTLDAHPDRGDTKCVVFLDSYSEKKSGLVIHGYDDDAEALAAVLVHLRAIFRANGKDLQFLPVGAGPEKERS